MKLNQTSTDVLLLYFKFDMTILKGGGHKTYYSPENLNSG